MQGVSKAIALAAAITTGCIVSSSAFACDITSPTDTSCGPANVNPGNPLSSLNPASPFYPKPPQPSIPAGPSNAYNPYSDPYSPYFSQPVYAYGILGLLEGPHPTMIYPAGPPILCRQGVDCPQDVRRARSAQAAYPTEAGPRDAYAVTRHHRRHHRLKASR